ncbi:MAG: hypothetical protein CL610_00520 [Anaerolineaceae bacterium]|nr:hypothetical protein [Anaerolineaceae bacterium]
MRYALLADMHGNSIGLDAVLEDIQRHGGVDAYMLLGDYCVVGPDPVGVLERLKSLPAVICIGGNGDSVIADVPFEHHVETNTSYSWTRGCVTQTGWYEWLTTLPLEQRLTLPDGTSLLAVHASPGNNNGDGLHPRQSDEAVQALFGMAEESLILVGHTHLPQERRLNGQHIVNPGSIGNPLGADTRACYGILDADESGYRISLHRVTYDTTAVLRQLDQLHHPVPGYISTFYRGEFIPRWDRDS